MKRFTRKDVQPGTRLVLARYPKCDLVFKGYGHGGDIVVRMVEPLPGMPEDMILRQKDVLIWEAE